MSALIIVIINPSIKAKKMKSEVLTLISVRDGLTRVLSKNIQLLGDIPLLAYTARAVVENVANRVIISTSRCVGS